MLQPARKLAFVLASSNHGAMIVNRLDFRIADNVGTGVGLQILEQGAHDAVECELAVKLLMLRRQFHGDGVVGIDCGANIGVHTLEWATAMTGWGEVVAIEAQERIYYALAGNIALNNCFNAIAIHGAVAAEPGIMKIPCPDYLMPGSFGSLELKQSPDNEFIGQSIDYDEANMTPVQKVPLDAALEGASAWITGARADQTETRREAGLASIDGSRNVLKFNPLFDWTRAAVIDAVAAAGVPVNALYDKGFVSIGCAPCTRAIAPGEPERNGRWWWESDGVKECGLHLPRPAATAGVPAACG